MAYGVEFLKRKLAAKSLRVKVRYKQYEQKKVDQTIGLVIPPELSERYRSVLGWCAKAVDTMADRLIFRGFANDLYDFETVFKTNNPDILFDSAILSALIASCSFIYIAQSENSDIPRLQVIDAANATGIIDPITGLLTEGYAVLEEDEYGNAKIEAYFAPDKTTITTVAADGKKTSVNYYHNAGYPLLVPIVHRPDSVRPFGRSRITRAAEYWQRYAKRTLERADVTAEFYSFPQKYVLGMSSEAEQLDTWTATITSMLRIDKDSDGDKPTLGQFTSTSMAPFTEQLRMAASGFAGETGLTLDDLGFVQENPSSAEAIKASHETLRLAANKAQRSFSSGLINVGYLATCLRDSYPYKREAFSNVEVMWEPTFAPDAATIGLIGDAAIKINQAVPGYFTGENLRSLTGIKGAGQ